MSKDVSNIPAEAAGTNQRIADSSTITIDRRTDKESNGITNRHITYERHWVVEVALLFVPHFHL